jgi:hypothetical protein
LLLNFDRECIGLVVQTFDNDLVGSPRFHTPAETVPGRWSEN